MKTMISVVALTGVFSLGMQPAAGSNGIVAAETDGSASSAATKLHSHLQEKAGVAQALPTSARMAGAPSPWADKSRHFHPRDR